jgi:hypothetical protein
MYNPTPEQADADRKKAFDTGVPHGALSRRSVLSPPGLTWSGVLDDGVVHTYLACLSTRPPAR